VVFLQKVDRVSPSAWHNAADRICRLVDKARKSPLFLLL